MKSNVAPKTITAGQVPPYSFQLPGMSVAKGAMEASKVLRLTHPCDVLAIYWQMRQVSKNEQAECSSAINNATKSVSGEFPALPQALPPINPTASEGNNA